MYVRDESRKRETPYATFILIGLNALAFVIEISITNNQRESLLLAWGVVPSDWQHAFANVLSAPPTLWLTLLSAQFFQVGWWHLLVNLVALLAAGARVEEEFGRVVFAAFYLVCGAIAFVLHIFIVGVQPVPTLGASGAVAGLLGAYVLSNWGQRVFIPLGGRGQSAPVLLLVGLWFIAQLLAGLAAVIPSDLGANIAWWIPASGFLFGLVLTRPLQRGLSWYEGKHNLAQSATYYNPYDNPDEEYRPPRPKTRAPYDNEDEDV